MTAFNYNEADVVNLQQQSPQQTEFDFIIVGSGAGGGISAEILARSGYKVCIIEEGPLRTANDFKMHEKEAYAELYQEVAARQTSDKAIQIMQGRAVGGSTTVNWTSSFRTPKQTLGYWQQQFALSEFSLDSMTPWFDWVEKRLNISPWALAPNRNNQLLADAAKKLGWHYKVIPRNVKGCANLGYCGMGCPLNAKQSMLVTTIPTALVHGSVLIHHARVDSLIIDGDKVTGVKVSAMDAAGQPQFDNRIELRANQIILAAGAIGTPAVLLRSGLERLNPAIGKGTFLHPVTVTLAKMAEPVNGFSGAPQSIYSDHFLWQHGVEGVPGFKIEVPPLHPVIAASLLKFHGQQHFDIASQLPYLQANLALIRDGFHPQSKGGQVSLDKFGYPQLNYPIAQPLWQAFREAMASMAKAQFAVGAKWVLPMHMDAKPMASWKDAEQAIRNLPAEIIRWQILSAHVMGGAAMNNKSGEGVCDSKGQFKGVQNLYVVDGSLFPTSLGVNPQLTIYSLAARLASQLVIDLGGTLPQDIAKITQNMQPG